MDKIDFVSQDKNLYAPKTDPEVVEVPTMWYLMYDGQGLPQNNPEFQQAFGALYGIAYSIKFLPKKHEAPENYVDFKVPPPEGLWWMEGKHDFDVGTPEEWRWTLMLRVPDFVTQALVDQMAEELLAKNGKDVYKKVRVAPLSEGLSVQVMHLGPYESEWADLASMAAYADAGGYAFTGKHHEIYFGDPRRTKPEKLRTILRHPVTAKV